MGSRFFQLLFLPAWLLLLWSEPCASTLQFTRGDFLDGFAFGAATSAYQEGGRGALYPEGLQFYNNLIDELVKAGIQINAVLYHIDLPQILEDEYNGWVSPKIIDDFTAYTDVCFREFGDRVAHWTTMLEPNILAQGSFDTGDIPPNHCPYPFGRNKCSTGNSTIEPYLFVHHSLLAHASAVRLYRENYQAVQKGIIGLNMYTMWLYPFTDSSEDIEATERDPKSLGTWRLSRDHEEDCWFPPSILLNYESELIINAFDFIGLNHDTSMYVSNNHKALEGPLHDFTADLAALFRGTKDAPPICDGKLVDPHGLELILEYFRENYGNISFYIHENGYGGSDDTLNDVERIGYMTKCIASILKAIRNEADVRGYSVWSFMDLYEIFGGFKVHYGIVAVDFNTDDKRRQLRRSAHWYFDFLKNNIVIKLDGDYAATLYYAQV